MFDIVVQIASCRPENSASSICIVNSSDTFDVDMELGQIGACDKEEFCQRITQLVSESQNCSVTEGDKRELQVLFDNSKTLVDAINAIGVLDDWKCGDSEKPLEKSKSEKVVYVLLIAVPNQYITKYILPQRVLLLAGSNDSDSSVLWWVSTAKAGVNLWRGLSALNPYF